MGPKGAHEVRPYRVPASVAQPNDKEVGGIRDSGMPATRYPILATGKFHGSTALAKCMKKSGKMPTRTERTAVMQRGMSIASGASPW
jgi:hypothetical protein